MTIEFECKNCGKLLRTKDDRAGSRANCPGCGEIVRVPSAGREDDGFDDIDDYEVDGYDEDEFDAPARSSSGMKSCPMCGEQVKAAASKCRYCGESLSGGRRSGGRRSDGRGRRRRNVEYAGFWMRFAAAFIDGLVLMIPMGILGCVLGMMMAAMLRPVGPGMQGPRALNFVINLIGFVAAWPYFAMMESSSNQATVGKMALGIIVTDGDGRRLSFGRASGRYFGKFLSQIICLIGYIMAGFTERKQALHDMMADCIVIRK